MSQAPEHESCTWSTSTSTSTSNSNTTQNENDTGRNTNTIDHIEDLHNITVPTYLAVKDTPASLLFNKQLPPPIDTHLSSPPNISLSHSPTTPSENTRMSSLNSPPSTPTTRQSPAAPASPTTTIRPPSSNSLDHSSVTSSFEPGHNRRRSTTEVYISPNSHYYVILIYI